MMEANGDAAEFVPCPYCDSEDYRTLFPAGDLLHKKPGVFAVAECRSCDGLYTNPRPRPSDLAIYYPEDYAPYLARPSEKRKSFLWSLLSEAFHWYMRSNDVIDILKEPGKRLLELGCSSGTYLASQKKYGLELHGVEFSEKPARIARDEFGLNVFCGQIEEARYPEEYFDAVAGWMVIEHLPSPRKAISEIRRILKKNGILVISVPNAGTWQFKVFGEDWYALDVPRHLNHFTVRSIQSLLRKEGFQIIEIHHQMLLDDFVASLGYLLQRRVGESRVSRWLSAFPDNKSRIVRFLVRPILQPFSWIQSLMRQSSRITAIARKS